MKKIILAIVLGMMVTFSASAFAQVAQMWRIAVTGVGGEDMGIVTVKEIDLVGTATPTIIGVDQSGGAGANLFDVSDDLTSVFDAAFTFTVTGSTGNDGTYTVTSSSYDSPSNTTSIVVDEVIPDATVDGNSRYTKSAVNLAGAIRDSASTNERGVAIPPVIIAGRTTRAADAAFDRNVGSKFRTSHAVGETNPLYLQYTWSTANLALWPDVTSYSITVEKVGNAPSTWTLQRNTAGKWVTVDSQFGVTFAEDEEKTFTVGQ